MVEIGEVVEIGEATEIEEATEIGEGRIKTATVIVGSVNLRAGPSRKSKIIMLASEGSVFNVVGEDTTDKEKWYKIETPDGREGWISATVVKAIESRVIDSGFTTHDNLPRLNKVNEGEEG